MELRSSTFSNGQSMPQRCGVDGGNVSPALSWTSPPAGTKSLALVMEDPDAPGSSPFVHWIVFNIPSGVTSMEEGSLPRNVRLGRNDAGTVRYFGPKPPRGTHRYVIRLYALDRELTLWPGADKAQLVKAMAGHELGMGEIVGRFSAGTAALLQNLVVAKHDARTWTS